jgi:hypothetical protein
VGCCRVVSLLTFDIPQTALVATLDTYDFIIMTSSESNYALTLKVVLFDQ